MFSIKDMFNVKKITSQNGFDVLNASNAHQNNYAWSMTELGDYIYVGTGRNIVASMFAAMIPGFKPSLDYMSNSLDLAAEIWRYKKDGSEPWERVLKTSPTAGVAGFRFMVSYNPSGLKPTLYAASHGIGVKIYKSTNGREWFELRNFEVQGTTSRCMMIYKEKLYLATIENLGATESNKPFIYSSLDPEVEGWKFETPLGGDTGKNLNGAVQFMTSFNNRIYVATTTPEGISIWRTEGEEIEQNKWKLVFDKGGGDAKNVFPASMGIYKDHLYLGTGVNSISPETLAIPKGADLFRIDKNDNWQLIVGGNPIKPTSPNTGTRNKAFSGYGSGFNNPYNFYMWQICEYNGQLLIGTYDSSSTVQTNLEMFKKNYDLITSDAFLSFVGSKENVDLFIKSLTEQAKALAQLPQTIGFDLYTSIDGVNFFPITLNGFGNSRNYGARMLFPSINGKLYIGTANPFEGCEVWESQPWIANYFDRYRGVNSTF